MDAPFTFEELVSFCGILLIFWIVGKMAERIGLPSLVGEILAGIAVGPHGLNIAPKPDALILVGEFGLVLMVLEAGIEVDLQQVAQVGARGVGVAFAGSVVPLAIGAGLSKLVFDMPLKSALAVGASLAPTSMGITLKVLQDGGVLSTPTGQLIIAAAVMDDVIALVLLSELEALRDPTPVNFLVPIISSVCFIVVVGYSAVRVIPKVLVAHVVPRVPKVHLEGVLLGLVFVAAYGLMVVLHYGKSSHLLGAFLGGLCFCSLASMQHIWHVQVEKILSWLVRVFFACSIGFEVPIRDLWTGPVLARTGVFLVAALGKIGTGLFAKPFSATEAAKIGFAMSAWGEFAFIVATASREAGTMKHEEYSAVVLAVLLSAIYSPFAVKFAIDVDRGNKLDRMKNSLLSSSADDSVGRIDIDSATEDGFPSARAMKEKHVLHRVYYVATIQCKSRWGVNDAVLKAIHDESVSLEVLDIAIKPSGGWTMCELFLRDPKLRAPIDATVKCSENRVVELKIPEMQKSLENAVLYGGKSRDGGDGEGTDGKGTEDEEEFPGEVLLARWLPDLVAYGGSIDDSDDEADDEIAFKQAEYMLHRGGVDAEDDTGDGDGIEGGGGGGPSGSKHSGGMHAEAGVAAMGSAPRTNHLMNSSALRMVHRTGSLLDLRGGLRNDMDSELLDAMCEGRLDPSQDVNRIRHRMGMGAVQKYQAAADEMQAKLVERELDHVMHNRNSRRASMDVPPWNTSIRRQVSLGSAGRMPAATSPALSDDDFDGGAISGGSGGAVRPGHNAGAASPTVDPSTVTLSGVMGARLASELRTNLSFQGPRRGDSTRGVMTRLGSGVRPQRRTSVSGIFHGAGGGGDGRRPSPSLRSDGHAGGSDFDNSPVVTLTGAGAQRLAMELRDQMLEKESRRSLSE